MKQKTELELIKIAGTDSDEHTASQAMKELKTRFDETYFYCIECDNACVKTKDCCLNQKPNGIEDGTYTSHISEVLVLENEGYLRDIIQPGNLDRFTKNGITKQIERIKDGVYMISDFRPTWEVVNESFHVLAGATSKIEAKWIAKRLEEYAKLLKLDSLFFCTVRRKK